MKKITSLSLGLSFLIMSYTGIMLFLAPKGKVAYWSEWSLFGLNKTQYGEIHTASMLTMLLFGVLHIYYNWKPIVSYLKDSSKKVSFTKKEFLVALSINLFFVLGTIYSIQPIKSFLDFNEDVKEYWVQKYGEPPYGHAEESKLKVFCDTLGLDLNQSIMTLKKNKIVAQESEPLALIAKNNGVTPQKIYSLIQAKNPLKVDGDALPSRLGRKTLKELAQLDKINLETAISILNSKGLKNVTKESKMKNIADELGLTPYDTYQIIKK